MDTENNTTSQDQVLQQVQVQETTVISSVSGVDKKNMSCQNVLLKEENATNVMGRIILLQCVAEVVLTPRITDLAMTTGLIVSRK
jgi:hypothetical protein